MAACGWPRIVAGVCRRDDTYGRRAAGAVDALAALGSIIGGGETWRRRRRVSTRLAHLDDQLFGSSRNSRGARGPLFDIEMTAEKRRQLGTF